MRHTWRIALLMTLVLVATSISSPAFAQGGTPQTETLPLTLFTSYPSQEAAIGEIVTLGLILRGGIAPQVVRLELQGLPEGWTATFRGGGRTILAAYVNLKNDTTVDLRVEPPKNVSAGTFNFTVIGRGEKEEVSLPIELTIKEKLPPNLKFEVELPTLRGAPNTTFRYSVTLKNEGAEDLSVNLLAEAPKGFQVNFKLMGQDVTSLPVAANESKSLDIEAKAFPDTPAGDYPINIVAQGGQVQANTQLIASVTGQSQITVTGPDGRLSGQAYVGSMTPFKIVVQNTGSAPALNVGLTASQPAGWTVEFEPKQIAEIPVNQQVEATANIQPAAQAIAGDYVVTINAQPEDGPSQSAEFRITVLTSTLWGIVGIALIAVAVAVVGLAVSRFGRR